jgi:hypothetical protein
VCHDDDVQLILPVADAGSHQCDRSALVLATRMPLAISGPLTRAVQVEQRPEHQSHVPAVDHRLDEADQEAAGRQPLEAGKELQPRLMQAPAGRDQT